MQRGQGEAEPHLVGATPCGEIKKGQSHVWQGQGTESLPSESALSIHHRNEVEVVYKCALNRVLNLV